jgi:hypothetical protein
MAAEFLELKEATLGVAAAPEKCRTLISMFSKMNNALARAVTGG